VQVERDSATKHASAEHSAGAASKANAETSKPAAKDGAALPVKAETKVGGPKSKAKSKDHKPPQLPPPIEATTLPVAKASSSQARPVFSFKSGAFDAAVSHAGLSISNSTFRPPPPPLPVPPQPAKQPVRPSTAPITANGFGAASPSHRFSAPVTAKGFSGPVSGNGFSGPVSANSLSGPPVRTKLNPLAEVFTLPYTSPALQRSGAAVFDPYAPGATTGYHFCPIPNPYF
jgi:hypothetical protein